MWKLVMLVVVSINGQEAQQGFARQELFETEQACMEVAKADMPKFVATFQEHFGPDAKVEAFPDCKLEGKPA